MEAGMQPKDRDRHRFGPNELHSAAGEKRFARLRKCCGCIVEVCCFGSPCPSLLLARCYIVDIVVMEAG